MTSDERPAEPAGEDGEPDPDDQGAPAADDDDELVRPVPDKIGEGGTNLRDREAALRRRRGGEPSS